MYDIGNNVCSFMLYILIFCLQGHPKDCIEIQSVGGESLAVYFNDVTVFHID